MTRPSRSRLISLEHLPRPFAAIAHSVSAGTMTPLHVHDRAQFLYAVSGSMKLTSALGSWILPPQRAVWIPAGYPHQPSSIGDVELRTLYIREDVCPNLAPKKPRMLRVSALLREMVLRITKMPVEYDEWGQDGQVLKTFLGEIDWAPVNPVSLPPLLDKRLKRLESRLMKTPGSTQTLEDWAIRMGCSSRTLARLFMKETGLSFHKWRDQIRTFAALPMIADGRSIVEIADELGYETGWAFSSMFKRVTGQLPSRYFSAY